MKKKFYISIKVKDMKNRVSFESVINTFENLEDANKSKDLLLKIYKLIKDGRSDSS